MPLFNKIIECKFAQITSQLFILFYMQFENTSFKYYSKVFKPTWHIAIDIIKAEAKFYS